jgi:hypothetical protein
MGSQGRVAQSGERHAYTVDVTGSSPVPPTMEIAEFPVTAPAFCEETTKTVYSVYAGS